ncbi:ceramide synthase isoform X3 [Chanodichthys erythropterus]|uniref:ceramide synthase isoform X3 n=1 Tax=Chanodichthys erythropterus TaxID=933992 RepID=UPI00351F7467
MEESSSDILLNFFFYVLRKKEVIWKGEPDGRSAEGFFEHSIIRVHLRGTMLSILAAGSVFFPGLFLLSRHCLKSIPGLRWSEGDAVIVSARHWLTCTYIWFAVPYFVYDIYAMFMCYWHKLQVKGHEVDNGSKSKAMAVRGYLRREFLMILHHVVMVTACFPISVFWRQGKGDYFQGVMFLAELSTPSVCLGKILIQYKQQHTLLHKVNGAVMLITFFLCRVLLFPYLYYVYGRYASIPFYRVPFEVPWQCNLGAALLMAPQLYWFSLICRGALRLFTGRSSRSRKPTAPVKPDYEGHEPMTQSANGYSTQMVGRDTPAMSH